MFTLEKSIDTESPRPSGNMSTYLHCSCLRPCGGCLCVFIIDCAAVAQVRQNLRLALHSTLEPIKTFGDDSWLDPPVADSRRDI